MTPQEPPSDIPHPHDFAEQLIRQVLADLDGILLQGEAPAADAFALLAGEAAAARPRGGALTLLSRAALMAHRALVFGRDGEAKGEFETVHDADVGAVLLQLGAAGEPQLPALLKTGEAIAHYVAAAEPAAGTPHHTLALAIYRLYEGLRNDDEALGGRGLVELRALVVHLDATALMLGQGNVNAEPLRAIRPDRFHDYFQRFTSLAQSHSAAGEEQAVATLSRDGRIEALVTADAVHPVVRAAKEVHEAAGGDETTKNHVLARIRALLVFLAALRRQPRALVGDPAADQAAQISLIIAAATAPLRIGEEFDFGALAQIARYNQNLLRGAQTAARRAH
jgi:hypothetical protein